MYEITSTRVRALVRTELEEAKKLVEQARDRLVEAKKTGAECHYLGYDMDDGDYALARISRTLDECLRETEVKEEEGE